MLKSTKVKLTVLLSSPLLVLSSCSLPGLPSGTSKNTLSVATLSTSESQILANIVKGMVEYHSDDLKVNLVNNLGTSTVAHQAMLRDDVNISKHHVIQEQI